MPNPGPQTTGESRALLADARAWSLQCRVHTLPPSPLQNETKRQEILCDLAMLADAVTAAQSHVGLECAGALLEQLYRKTSSFHLLLQTFSWQVSPTPTPPTLRGWLQGHWPPGFALGHQEPLIEPLLSCARWALGAPAAPHGPWPRATPALHS